MKRAVLGSFIGILLVLTGCDKAVDFNNGEQKISYVLGQSIGANIQSQGMQVNEKSFLQGVQDGLKQTS